MPFSKVKVPGKQAHKDDCYETQRSIEVEPCLNLYVGLGWNYPNSEAKILDKNPYELLSIVRIVLMGPARFRVSFLLFRTRPGYSE